MPRKYTVIDKGALREIKDDLSAVLKDFFEARGIEFKYGMSHYTGLSNGDIKIDFNIAGEESAEARSFKKNAFIFGLDPEDLGKEFDTPEGRGKIIGLHPTKRKSPIIIEFNPGSGRYAGKQLLFTAQQARFYINASKAASK